MSASFWSKNENVLLEELNSSTEGLSQKEAEVRLKKFGLNAIKEKKRIAFWHLLFHQFANPLILILLSAAILSLILYQTTDAIIILAIITFSGLLGFWQEKKAAYAIRDLEKMIQLDTRVLRDGAAQTIATQHIVPGDVLILNAGDIIPADCMLLHSKDLFVDESVLTGESYPVWKGIQANHSNERSRAVFMGTHVISGTATALTVLTGKKTEFGKIAEHLKTTPPPTEFESGMRRFGYFLLEITFVLIILIFAFNALLHHPLIDSFLFSLAIGVGLVPQLLPAIISVNLAHGAKKMANREVIVRKLISLENFGSMDVLCSDKTGTLTAGITNVRTYLNVKGEQDENVLFYAYLNSSFQKGYTNPIDSSISTFKTFDLSSYKKLDEIPFDFMRKQVSVLAETQGEALLVTKGAFKSLISKCTHAEVNHHQIIPISDVKENIEKTFEKWSSQGYRLIGIAYKKINGKAEIDYEDENDLVFLGFVIFSDPPKEGIKETIEDLKDLGISLKILTGDNALVAKQIAEEIGLAASNILTGKEIAEFDDRTLLEKVKGSQVFAEVSPEQKEKIIEAFRKNGHVVGYMGDGVNDSAALHKADVGISVNTAIDVVKEEADIVLLRKELSVLLDGVKEGRKTFVNTMKYVYMATSANFGNMFSMAGASLFLSFLPLLPKQVLLTNFLTDFPEMTICTDRIDKDVETRPTRFNLRFIGWFMVVFGLISTIFDYMTFGVLLYLNASVAQFRTGWFMESVISASLIVLVIRTKKPFFRSRPSFLLAFSICMICLITILLPYSPLKGVLSFTPLPITFLFFIFFILCGYILVVEIAKRFFYKAFQP